MAAHTHISLVVERFIVSRIRCRQKPCKNFAAPIPCRIALIVNGIPMDAKLKDGSSIDLEKENEHAKDIIQFVYEIENTGLSFDPRFFAVNQKQMFLNKNDCKKNSLKALISLVSAKQLFSPLMPDEQEDLLHSRGIGVCQEHYKLIKLKG